MTDQLIKSKWMQHPHSRPPYIDRNQPKNSRGIFLPPIQVHSVDQEGYARGQGYEDCPNNIPNPNQYKPVYGSGDPAAGEVAYVHQEYPKWVNGVLCESEAEEARVMAATAPINDVNAALVQERRAAGLAKARAAKKEKKLQQAAA